MKAIWRLMRARRSELLRAWGYSALNVGISIGAMFLYVCFVGLVMVLIPGSWEQKAVAVFVVGVLAYCAYIPLAMALSLYLGLANMHYFGSYGTAAYHLREVRLGGDRPSKDVELTGTR